jgi:hypothetical protein
VHLHFRHRTFKHGCRLVGGQHIGGRCAVRHLGHHILTNAEIFDDDLAVFVGSEYADISVRSGDTEREALNFAVRGSLDDFQRADLRRIDKALSGLVLHGHDLAVLDDFKIVGVIVQIETLRRFRFFDEIAAVEQVGHFINADAGFGQRADQFIVRIQFLVAVAVTVNSELRTRQLAVGIVPVGLGELHRATDTGIFDLYLDHRTVRIDGHRMGFLRQHETGRSFDLPHDPVAVRHTGKRKTAVLGRGGSQDGVFRRKLGAVRTEQPDQRTGKTAAVLVLFQSVDLAVEQLVFDECATVCLKIMAGQQPIGMDLRDIGQSTTTAFCSTVWFIS